MSEFLLVYKNDCKSQSSKKQKWKINDSSITIELSQLCKSYEVNIINHWLKGEISAYYEIPW